MRGAGRDVLHLSAPPEASCRLPYWPEQRCCSATGYKTHSSALSLRDSDETPNGECRHDAGFKKKNVRPSQTHSKGLGKETNEHFKPGEMKREIGDSTSPERLWREREREMGLG